MNETDKNLKNRNPFGGSDKFVLGSDTRETVARLFTIHNHDREILVGKCLAHFPYESIRHQAIDGLIIATLEGEGEVWVGRRWNLLKKGRFFFSPPGHDLAWRALPGKSWSFSWMQPSRDFCQGTKIVEPQIIHLHPHLLLLSIEGLMEATLSKDNQILLASWSGLVSAYAKRLILSGHDKSRLEKVWQAVLAEPNREWNIQALCRLAGLSHEPLRRRVILETGRAPMQHVKFLRTQIVLQLLQTTQWKLDRIAEWSGFCNAFALSDAVKLLTGQRPSTFRRELVTGQNIGPSISAA